MNTITSDQLNSKFKRTREYGTYKKPRYVPLPKRPPAVAKDDKGKVTDTPEVVKEKETALKAHDVKVRARMRTIGYNKKRTGPQKKLEKKKEYDPEWLASQKKKLEVSTAQKLKEQRAKRKKQSAFKGPKVRTGPSNKASNQPRGGYSSTAHSV